MLGIMIEFRIDRKKLPKILIVLSIRICFAALLSVCMEIIIPGHQKGIDADRKNAGCDQGRHDSEQDGVPSGSVHICRFFYLFGNVGEETGHQDRTERYLRRNNGKHQTKPGVDDPHLSHQGIQADHPADDREHLRGEQQGSHQLVPFGMEPGDGVSGENGHNATDQRAPGRNDEIVAVIDEKLVILFEQGNKRRAHPRIGDEGRRIQVRFHAS